MEDHTVYEYWADQYPTEGFDYPEVNVLPYEEEESNPYLHWAIGIVIASSLILLTNLVGVILLLVNRELRSDVKERLPLAMMISIIITTTIGLAASVGMLRVTTWTNYQWLCLSLYPIMATFQNLMLLFLTAAVGQRYLAVGYNFNLSNMAVSLTVVIAIVVMLIWQIIEFHAIPDGMQEFRGSSSYHCQPSYSASAIHNIISLVLTAILLVNCVLGVYFFCRSTSSEDKPKDAEGESSSSSPRDALRCSFIVGFVFCILMIPHVVSMFLVQMELSLASVFCSDAAMALVPVLWIILQGHYRSAFKVTFLPCLASGTSGERTKLLT